MSNMFAYSLPLILSALSRLRTGKFSRESIFFVAGKWNGNFSATILRLTSVSLVRGFARLPTCCEDFSVFAHDVKV